MNYESTLFSLIESGIDISIYARPEFDWEQMVEIRLGLKSGLGVLIYTKPEIHEKNAST